MVHRFRHRRWLYGGVYVFETALWFQLHMWLAWGCMVLNIAGFAIAYAKFTWCA